MGHLLGLPISTDNGFSDDKRPKNVSECYVNGKLKRKRFQQYQKRSNDESRRVLVDLLFSKSPLVLVDDDNENNGSEGADEQQPPGAEEVVRAEKRRRTRDKHHGVTFVDSHSGERLRLYPKMSVW